MKMRMSSALIIVLLLCGTGNAQLADEFSPPRSNCCLANTAKSLADQLQDWNQLGRYHQANQQLNNQPADAKRVVFMGDSITDIWRLDQFLPRTMTANTPATIVCPGGGYVNLAMNHEGRQVASYLNSLGMAAFVLRSRLGPRYHHPTELGDAQRAIRMLRTHAVEWRLDPARIGIVGFSAGGHLAMTASTHFDAGNADATDIVDRANSRPDFAVLGYPVISMTEAWTHQGSKNNLLAPIQSRSSRGVFLASCP